jgi:hypothetical protein
MTQEFRIGDRVEWAGRSEHDGPKKGERGWLVDIHPFGDIIRWDDAEVRTAAYTQGLLPVRRVGDRNEPDPAKRRWGDPYDERWDGRDDDLRREFASLPTSVVLGFMNILQRSPDQETMTDEDLQFMSVFSSHASIRLVVAVQNESVKRHLIKMIEGIVQERAELRAGLLTLTPAARGDLRSVLNRDTIDRDSIAAVLPDDDAEGLDWRNLADLLTADPRMRRTVIRQTLVIDDPGRRHD